MIRPTTEKLTWQLNAHLFFTRLTFTTITLQGTFLSLSLSLSPYFSYHLTLGKARLLVNNKSPIQLVVPLTAKKTNNNNKLNALIATIESQQRDETHSARRQTRVKEGAPSKRNSESNLCTSLSAATLDFSVRMLMEQEEGGWSDPENLNNALRRLNNEVMQVQPEQWPKKQGCWSLDLDSEQAMDPRQAGVTTSTESSSVNNVFQPQQLHQPPQSLGIFQPKPQSNDTDLSAVRDLFLSALEPSEPPRQVPTSQRSQENTPQAHARSISQEALLAHSRSISQEALLAHHRSISQEALLAHHRSISQEGTLSGKYGRSSMSPIVKHHFTKQGHTNIGRPAIGLGQVPLGFVQGVGIGMTPGSGELVTDPFFRSTGSPSTISEVSQSQHGFTITPQDNLSATHTNGFLLASADVSLNSSFRNGESGTRATGEKRINAAATYTSGILNPMQQLGCISVVDPQRRKLQLPANVIRHTKALGCRLTTPSLCLLYQAGRCRQGANCYQVHADPEAVAALRAKAERQLCCCSVHGDANSHMWNAAAHSHRSISIGRAVIPLDHVAFTAGLQRILSDDRVTVPVNPSLLCRLQEQPTSCRYGADCKFLHVCREILNANPGDGDNPSNHSSAPASNAPTRAGPLQQPMMASGDFSASLNGSQMLGSESSLSVNRFTSALPAPFAARTPVPAQQPIPVNPVAVQQPAFFFQAPPGTQVPQPPAAGLPTAQPQFLLRQVNCDGSVTFVPVSIFQEPGTIPTF
eukprot:gene10210-7154_t